MKKILAGLGMALVGAGALAQDATETAPPDVPRTPYMALLASSLIGPDDKRNPQLDGGIGGDLRYGQRPADGGWGFEVHLFQESLHRSDGASGNRGGLGADALYRLPQFLYVTVYGLGGVALVYGLGGVALAYSDALPGRDWVAPVANLGVGLESGALFAGLRLRAEYRYNYEDNRDEYVTPTDYDRANYLESRVFAGLSYEFAAPPPQPETIKVKDPEPVAPPPAPAD